MTDNEAKKPDPFMLLIGLAATLAIGAGVWWVVSIVELRSARTRIEMLTEDKKQAEAYLKAHPDLVSGVPGSGGASKPYDHVKFLQDFMNVCAKNTKVTWTRPPHHDVGRGGERWEASATCEVGGDSLVSLAYLLDSGRSQTSVFKFSARRSGANAQKPGPATWKTTFWIKAPKQHRKRDETTNGDTR